MFMIEDERFQAYRKLHESVREIRGRILNSVAVIDVKISEILTAYFCNDDKKRALLMSEVFSNQAYGLRTKIMLLETIVKRDFDFYIKDKDNDCLFKDLDRLRKFRNDLAHATIDVSEKAHKNADKEVGFVFYKNGERKTKIVSFKKADDYRVKANMVSGCLTEIGRLLGINI